MVRTRVLAPNLGFLAQLGDFWCCHPGPLVLFTVFSSVKLKAIFSGLTGSQAVLVCKGSHTKVPQTGRLQQHKFILSQF